jgi:hypothetical protein
MAGYAATARITHVAPHRVSHEAPVEPPDVVKATTVAIDAPAVEEVSGQPFLSTLIYVWDDIREVWRQGMDVLRDPQSIR